VALGSCPLFKNLKIIMEKVEEKINEIGQKLDRVMDYVILMDRTTNREAAKKLNVKWGTFKNWLTYEGFPRLDSENVSVSQVQKWMADRVSRRSKKL
jgi:hypothetical protein